MPAVTATSRLFLSSALTCIALLGCGEPAQPNHPSAGDPERGRLLLWQFGCGSCHQIRGVVGAIGEVGPPLDGIAGRVYIAGVLANTPDNLAHWIRFPQKVDPLTAMPQLGVTEEQARDMVAYLQNN